MPAYGSLATIGVAELLQIAALFRKMGSLRLLFRGGRIITVYVQDGNLSGLTDTGRVWQLGDLLGRLGRLSELDKQRLVTDVKVRGKRLGQLLLDEGYVSRGEMEDVLRRLIMQSLLFAVENQESGEFELTLGAVSQTSVQFPITDFLMEIISSVDGYRHLLEILGSGEGALALEPGMDLSVTAKALPYRQVQVLAHVDGEKTPMEIAATSPLSPTETLHILGRLAQAGIVIWEDGACDRPLAQVVQLSRQKPVSESPIAHPIASDPVADRLTPGSFW
jgi:hypothetical protein